MSCHKIEAELLSYHFGMIDAGPRRQVEAHVLCCPDCLHAYLSLKRDIETAESVPAPSPAVRARLRASAACELGLGEPRRWSWWERPLAFGISGMLVVFALVAAATLARGPGAPPRGLIDAPVASSPAR